MPWDAIADKVQYMSMVKLAITPEDADDSAEELPLPPRAVAEGSAKITPADTAAETAEKP